ncbi:hypothetical protein XAC3562_1200051 [Xanthomonas citri pv. citri]|uniref:Uncharacterized protein n=1 Tax=Xanthomonas citri pv. citri TaxID=611301 RepID=A0A0U5F959_XANCI|nr:hypothetical protein XAC3608_2050016 [Xanthomonas citri pv. citri]CEG14728.1 hypothetical protein XAC3562_1200051 [Xanthomonas citri pv. citri]
MVCPRRADAFDLDLYLLLVAFLWSTPADRSRSERRSTGAQRRWVGRFVHRWSPHTG